MFELAIAGTFWVVIGTLFAFGYNLGTTLYQLSGYYMDQVTTSWSQY